jgi:RNA polymerase sigma factor (sigma-70 family)
MSAVLKQKKISSKSKKVVKGRRSSLTKLEKQETSQTLLSEEEKRDLVLEYRMKARKLSRSILRRWRARIDIEEVDSIVDISLCEAVKRFNPSKGAGFMTFMFFHLRGNLIRAVATAVQLQTCPAFNDEIDAFSPQNEANGHVLTKTGTKGPSVSDVTVALYNNEDLLPDDALEKKQLATLSRNACANLDPLEREVIDRLFFKEQQLLDIADDLGYSRCHISRVKKRALQILKEELEGVFGGKAGPNGRVSTGSKPKSSEATNRIRASERRTIRRRRPRTKKASVALVAAGEKCRR